MLINGREKVGIENLINPKAFTDYSQSIDDVYENLEDYNPTKKRRELIVFDDMKADMKSNKVLVLLNFIEKKITRNSFKSFVWHWF